ncbi:hypothetical protein AB0J86_21440 [Micromonospora sp. NPDC049559]|uniref:hypothetical protein n=1 Tax=Micromonospora sp. NPDC049559 TaxID=3155923 RepID=UPI003426FED5
MKIRRWSTAGLAAALLLSGLTACAPGGTTPGAGTTPSATGSGSPASSDEAKRVLLASTAELAKGNFKFAIGSDQVTGDGWVHQASQSAQMRTRFLDSAGNVTTDITLVYRGSDAWVQLKLDEKSAKSLPGAQQFISDKFLHLDKNKIKNAKNLRLDMADPAGSEQLTKAVVEVRQDSAGSFSGKIDLAKATGARLLDNIAVDGLPAQGSTVPFTAKLDGENRLRELAIQLPAVGTAKAQTLRLSYSDYGAAEPAEAPPANEVTEAPEQLYTLFNQ